jgi:hypothetical protein
MRLSKAEKNQLKAKRLAQLRENLAIVRRGTCPTCGTKLYRNLALTGWFQCGHLGAPGFKAEASSENCDYQMFYDPTESERQILFAEGN